MLHLFGRNKELFEGDIKTHEEKLSQIVSGSSFLVLGGAGSIGQSVTKEIFKRNPLKLHVVDISENNLVELVRDIRSSFGYIDGDFKTFALDAGSVEYDAFIEADGEYDYFLNLSALKHVRSERDPFTLMRMIDVNILNTVKTIQQCIKRGSSKYFSVSSDKAANPVNMMGASKRIMEMFLIQYSTQISISTSRFANVAFSDGSLLYGFHQRIQKKQPIVAPNDVKRFFISPKESGELCLMSCIFGETGDTFFPILSNELHLITFSDIAVKFLGEIGFEPYICKTESEARELMNQLPEKGQWPCLFTSSDTTGEKDYEEFYTEGETLELQRFKDIGVIKNQVHIDNKKLRKFIESIREFKNHKRWTKNDLVTLFIDLIPNFEYVDKGKYLDAKM